MINDNERYRLIGSKLRERRLEKGWSQKQLEDMCGLTYISEIETGKNNFSLKVLFKIADALEISLSDIFSDVQ